MNLFSVEFMSDEELLDTARKSDNHKNEIQVEWRKRHDIDFPYVVTDEGHIKNCLLGALVGSFEVQEKVNDQAREIIENRNKNT